MPRKRKNDSALKNCGKAAILVAFDDGSLIFSKSENTLLKELKEVKNAPKEIPGIIRPLRPPLEIWDLKKRIRIGSKKQIQDFLDQQCELLRENRRLKKKLIATKKTLKICREELDIFRSSK